MGLFLRCLRFIPVMAISYFLLVYLLHANKKTFTDSYGKRKAKRVVHKINNLNK